MLVSNRRQVCSVVAISHFSTTMHTDPRSPKSAHMHPWSRLQSSWLCALAHTSVIWAQYLSRPSVTHVHRVSSWHLSFDIEEQITVVSSSALIRHEGCDKGLSSSSITAPPSVAPPLTHSHLLSASHSSCPPPVRCTTEHRSASARSASKHPIPDTSIPGSTHPHLLCPSDEHFSFVSSLTHSTGFATHMEPSSPRFAQTQSRVLLRQSHSSWMSLHFRISAGVGAGPSPFTTTISF
mmetsp:Transcript_13385/g.31364  ORF Transcript_13385/g.31364 Transcript_13385/m.31364 type:complete len:237 (-) Transcript_13385:548-1258(-)